MDFEARDGVALVVGGSGGIGRAIVRLLAERGSDVVVTYRSNAPAATRVAEEASAYGVSARTLQLELPGSAAAAAEIGAIHTLVYAAGPQVPMTHLSKVDPLQMTEQLTLDAAAFFAVAHAALPALRAVQGTIVAVSTAATTRYPVRDGLSSVPKAAVEAAVRAIAVEEGRYGVRANSVGPGMLTDGMAERLIASGELDEAALAITRGNIPLRRFGIANDIAEAVCFLASDRAGFISGQKLDVDGGWGA